MKISKQGKIKLGINDTRIANFVYSDEENYIKLQDISQGIIVRFKKKASARAIVIEDAMLNKHLDILEKYAIFTFYTTSVAVDKDCFENVIKEFNDCVQRHAEAYGLEDNISIEEDKEIIKDQKEITQAISDLKEVLDTE